MERGWGARRDGGDGQSGSGRLAARLRPASQDIRQRLRPGAQIRSGTVPARRERLSGGDGEHADPSKNPAKITENVALV
jgi:hypothetical protein